MDAIASQVATTHHLRFLIFDWALPNVIMGVVLIAIFFLAAWARLPKWLERGRDRSGRDRDGGKE